MVNTDLLKAKTQKLLSIGRIAEREFSAFFSAVVEMFGPENAKFSVEKWLQGLLAIRASHHFE